MKRFLILCISIMMLVSTIGIAPSHAFNAGDLDDFVATLHCEGCDLSGADLSEADLVYAALIHTDLSNADLSYSYIINAELVDVNLSGAKLIGAEFHDNWMENIDLTGADLTDAIADEESLYYDATLCNTTMPFYEVENQGC